ncbi:HTH domain-containing protein [Streptomyces sp. NPDC048665]|uniref:helix-turn-helix transcriptional regulator n=1 Tax=Streptomyces sp. NPDC048665 TaxID=3155490 RepID=UPI003427CD38
MKRTARLHALVGELRAAAPRLLTVAALAARFETSTRTVQRDLQALMEAGVPVPLWAKRGLVDRPGDDSPPIRFTAAEASALVTALALADASAPYASAARTAWCSSCPTPTRQGQESDLVVEPAGTAHRRRQVVSHRLVPHTAAGRGFRLERITAAAPTGEQAQPHDLADLPLGSAVAAATQPAALASLMPRS